MQSALAQSCFLLHKSQYFTSLNILQPQYFADFKYLLNPASLLEIVFHQPSPITGGVAHLHNVDPFANTSTMWIPLARPAVAIKGHKHSFGYKMDCCPLPCLPPQLTGTTYHQWTHYLAITSSNVREQTIRAPCVRPTLPYSGQYCAHCCMAVSPHCALQCASTVRISGTWGW